MVHLLTGFHSSSSAFPVCQTLSVVLSETAHGTYILSGRHTNSKIWNIFREREK